MREPRFYKKLIAQYETDFPEGLQIKRIVEKERIISLIKNVQNRLLKEVKIEPASYRINSLLQSIKHYKNRYYRYIGEK